MKKQKRNILDGSVKIIVVLSIVTFIIPIVINLFLYLPFPPTPSDLGNKDWLAFWGSFLGGCFGGIATLFAVYYTLKQNLSQHQQLMDEQNKKTRLEVLPFIDIKIIRENGKSVDLSPLLLGSLLGSSSNNSDKKDKNSDEPLYQFPSGYIIFEEEMQYHTSLPEDYKRIFEFGGLERKQTSNGYAIIDSRTTKMQLLFSNIGLYSAIGVVLTLMNKDENVIQEYLMPSFNMRAGENVILNFVFGKNFASGDYLLQLSFQDIYSNKYYQKQTFNYINDSSFCQVNMESISTPTLT